MELVGYEDVEAGSHEALASLVVHLIAENGTPINKMKFNIKRIHDELSKLVYKMDHTNVKLQYPEKIIIKLEKDYNNYEIKLVKDTYEIVNIGQKMHICVGSYANSAAKNNCHIMYIKNKETKEYVACIELSKDYKNLYQIKGNRNFYLYGEVAEIATKWLKETKLQIATNDVANFSKEKKSINAFGEGENANYAVGF